MKKKLPTPQRLPSGMYRCQVTVDGKRISITDEDPKVAQAKAISIRAGIVEKQESQRAGASSITLLDAIDQYITLKEGVLSPATIRGYECIKKHRFKMLMRQRIKEIEKRDVQRAISEESKLVSPKTVANAYGLIRPVLKEYGVDVFGVKLPQKQKQNKRYLQPEDIGKLMESAEGDSCEAAVLIAAWLGLRRSEIIGICWDCVDFERKTITVRRVVVPDKKNKMVSKDVAKNETSQRTISCPDYIIEKLLEMYNPGDAGQVFKIHPDTLRKHLHRICKKAGITDTTVHGLRHTNAAVMKSLGIDDAHAMARGGWSCESTYKKTYSYVFDQVANDSDREINGFFEKLHTKSHTNS